MTDKTVVVCDNRLDLALALFAHDRHAAAAHEV